MKVTWLKTDEAPSLAGSSLLPMVEAFLSNANIEVEVKNISLAKRILSQFPEFLTGDQQSDNDLKYLSTFVNNSDANIIKLPNISASVNQLKACILELQNQSFSIPNYPETATTKEELDIQNRYSTCLGSAVNPILRQGNSDRRVADAVKEFARENPHDLKAFDKDSLSCIKYMNDWDFYGSEQSIVKKGNGKVFIKLKGKNLKEFEAIDKEIIDTSFLTKKKYLAFLQNSIDEAKEKNLLWSIHLKATMMKSSDPIMFGHAVAIFFKGIFTEFESDFKKISVDPNLGLLDLIARINELPEAKQTEIKNAILMVLDNQPELAMVSTDKGITNLHSSNNVIIDASLPVVIKNGGKMLARNNRLENCMAVIPDRCYATIYEECLNNCKEHGPFDVKTMGNVSNIGLMAGKAEEYGSHPTTFEIPETGLIEVVDENDNVLMKSTVEQGDIWRLSRTKHIPVLNWISLAVKRAEITGLPTIFWLDKNRAHDNNIIQIVENELKERNITNFELLIKSPQEAMRYTISRIRKGLNTISVTGNVLRDYLTDLFPILELGTSSKMLSIVPLIAGGGLFETGAGGTAPVLVDNFINSGHLSWDSLGEFLALAESLRFFNQEKPNVKTEVLVSSIDIANNKYLKKKKSPSEDVFGIDTMLSHYYFAMYWAEAISKQTKDIQLADKFKVIYNNFKNSNNKIKTELKNKTLPIVMKGYYNPTTDDINNNIRCSKTLNDIIATL